MNLFIYDTALKKERPLEEADLSGRARSYAWNTDGTLNYVEEIRSGVTFRRTYTYTNGNVTAVSDWVQQ